MKIIELDDYFLSPSALNPFSVCESKWFEHYVLGSEILVATRPIFFEQGNRVHDIEKNFWLGMMLRGKKIMNRIATASLSEVFDMLMIYKSMLLGSHEETIAEYSANLAWIDACRFIDLREYFDGNFDQAWKYLLPVGVEMQQKNPDTRTNIKMDRVCIIPARYKYYKNLKDALVVIDYKPGHVYDGIPKLIRSNGEYDKSYGGGFNRQLAFYLDGVEYPKSNPIQEKFAAGMYYKTRQFVVDKFDGRTYKPLREMINRFWNMESFERCDLFNWEHKRKYQQYDTCCFCEYRLTCRSTLSLWLERGPARNLKDYVRTKECKICGKKFTNFKWKGNRICENCYNHLIEWNSDVH